MNTMTIQLETITPEVAQRLLEGNTDNRACRVAHVTFLTQQMQSGLWQVTGDPIKIGLDGRLLDGQHRLMAVVASQITQSFYVARDCAEAIFAVLDTGKNRTAADVVGISGRKSPALLASAAKILILHQIGSLVVINNTGRRQTANSAILNFLIEHDLEEAVRHAGAWTKRSKLLNPGEWAALYYLFSAKAGPESSYAFLQQISTGLNLTEGHPVFLLRQKLQSARDGRYNFTPAERLALTIKAWNHVRDNKKITQLTWKNYEEFPEIE